MRSLIIRKSQLLQKKTSMKDYRKDGTPNYVSQKRTTASLADILVLPPLSANVKTCHVWLACHEESVVQHHTYIRKDMHCHTYSNAILTSILIRWLNAIWESWPPWNLQAVEGTGNLTRTRFHLIPSHSRCLYPCSRHDNGVICHPSDEPRF